MTQPGSEATSPRWIENERAVRLLKFLAAGLPSFLLAVFEERGESILREFGQFVAGILGFRAADWLVYVLLVDVCGLYCLAVSSVTPCCSRSRSSSSPSACSGLGENGA